MAQGGDGWLVLRPQEELDSEPANEFDGAHGEPLESSREQRQGHVFFSQALLLVGQALAAPGQFRDIAHAVHAGELAFAENHQVVRQTQEVRLHGLGVGRTRPGLGFAQLVFEFVKGLFDLPAQPVEMGEHAGWQRVLAAEEAELFAAQRIQRDRSFVEKWLDGGKWILSDWPRATATPVGPG